MRFGWVMSFSAGFITAAAGYTFVVSSASAQVDNRVHRTLNHDRRTLVCEILEAEFRLSLPMRGSVHQRMHLFKVAIAWNQVLYPVMEAFNFKRVVPHEMNWVELSQLSCEDIYLASLRMAILERLAATKKLTQYLAPLLTDASITRPYSDFYTRYKEDTDLLLEHWTVLHHASLNPPYIDESVLMKMTSALYQLMTTNSYLVEDLKDLEKHRLEAAAQKDVAPQNDAATQK